MILFDSNIIIDAHDQQSTFCSAATGLIGHAVEEEGAAINAIVLAELAVGQESTAVLQTELLAEGFEILDLPAAAAGLCARAYTQYRAARKQSGGGDAPAIPLPDFFIGAHAELMGWKLATRDTERFRAYFPRVELITP